jgi:type IV pilus assembly protein PilC
MTLLAAMRTTGEQCGRDSMRRIWDAVSRRVQAGSSFADALVRHRCFPSLVVQLIRVGEQTGTLEPVLRRGADIMERRRSLRNSLLTALAYPTIVLTAAMGVTAFMVLNVIPKLEVFLKGLGRKLPATTQAMVDISRWAQDVLPQAAIGAVAMLVALALAYLWPPGRLVLDRLLLRMPILGHLLRLAATALVSRALGMLIRSGVTLLEALRTVESLHRNRHLRRCLAAARENVLVGGNLADGLRAAHAFLPMLAAMTAVGESTGMLDDVLDETARFHEEQLQLAIRRFSAIIEPVIVVVVGGIVGFVYISFFLALFAAAGSAA